MQSNYFVTVTGPNIKLHVQPKVHTWSNARALYLGLCMLYANIARVALYDEERDNPNMLRCTAPPNC